MHTRKAMELCGEPMLYKLLYEESTLGYRDWF